MFDNRIRHFLKRCKGERDCENGTNMSDHALRLG